MDTETSLIDIYKILIGQIQFEGKLIWTRNQVFLVLNSAIIAVLSVSGQGQSGSLATIAASVIGVVLCILWIFTVARSRAYYRYWVTQARAVERLLKLDVKIFDTLSLATQAKTRGVIKIGDFEFSLGRDEKFASISRITLLVAYVFIVVWILLSIAVLGQV